MTIDLDKLERLAKAAPKDFGPSAATWEYVEALNPAVVLQWIAETRAHADKLRAAVEALERAGRWCSCNERTNHDEYCAITICTTALATLSAPTGDKVK